MNFVYLLIIIIVEIKKYYYHFRFINYWFLIFLKEKDNKINHFDEEVIDLILFDDLNININMDEEPKEKGKNYSQQKNITQLKSSFDCEEIKYFKS